MNYEKVYLGHDNSIDLLLKADGEAAVLSSVTRMTLTVASLLIDSDNGDSDPIRWAKSGYATGEIRLFLGGLELTPGTYNAPLVVYDPTNLDGVLWDYVKIIVIADPEAEPAP